MLDPDCFEYLPAFLPQARADAWLRRLWRELNWNQQKIRLFGRCVMQPRLIAWHGDPGAIYTYSGLTLGPQPWHPVLEEIRRMLETRTGGRFNSVLANAYRDGRDSMGWHSDDEWELGTEPLIASVSLGAARRFRVRPRPRRADAAGASGGILLEHGSLLLMKGASQRRFQHALPRTRKPVGLRVNLTYRLISTQAED